VAGLDLRGREPSQGLDWPRTAHTMAGLARLRDLRDLTQLVIDQNVPGDVIETGVWRGGCCILMKGILRSNLDMNRKVYVADSFAGLPPPDPVKYRDPADDPHHTLKELWSRWSRSRRISELTACSERVRVVVAFSGRI
jgi:hypothetical protein